MHNIAIPTNTVFSSTAHTHMLTGSSRLLGAKLLSANYSHLSQILINRVMSQHWTLPLHIDIYICVLDHRHAQFAYINIDLLVIVDEQGVNITAACGSPYATLC